nr:universal stress protein [Streptomyces kaniharaensis]
MTSDPGGWCRAIESIDRGCGRQLAAGPAGGSLGRWSPVAERRSRWHPGCAGPADRDLRAVVPVPGPLVVGVGRSAAGRGAVSWAADEAARTGRALRLVHVLAWPRTDPDEDTPRLLDDHVRGGGDIVLAQARKLVEERHPSLETGTRVVDGPRARGLPSRPRTPRSWSSEPSAGRLSSRCSRSRRSASRSAPTPPARWRSSARRQTPPRMPPGRWSTSEWTDRRAPWWLWNSPSRRPGHTGPCCAWSRSAGLGRGGPPPHARRLQAGMRPNCRV